MDEPLRILLLEDNEPDAEMAQWVLRKGGISFEARRVETPDAFLDAIQKFQPDVVLADFSLPQFHALDALKLLRQRSPGIPFVLLTGSLTEEVAVECMRQGVDDYILKSSTKRLPQALMNALNKKKAEREKEKAELALRVLKKAVETLQLGVTITDLDRKIIYVNPAEAHMHGYEVEDLFGKDVRIFAPVERWTPISLDSLKSLRRESTNIRRDGTLFAVQLTSDVVTDSAGKPVAVVTACEDITERKRMEEALKESEERYALAARGSNEGLYDWNLKTNEVYFADRWKSMLGHAPEDIGRIKEEWFKRIHPDDSNRVQTEIESHIKGVTPYFESEHRMLHLDGNYRWMLARGIAVFDSDGSAYRMAGSQTDITGRKLAEEQLVHDALHDSLTGLPNRSLLVDRLKNALERCKRREEYAFAVLFLDLDRFKVVNDSLGHMAGDELLIAVARRLVGCVRPGDSVARLGGDEFALLLEDIPDVIGAVRVSNRVQKDLKIPFNLNGQEIFTTVSIGIALSRRSYSSPEELLRDADTAMYRAKNQGRARHELFDTGMRTHAVKLMQLETDLRKATERQEFQIHYQPIVTLETGRIEGFEALIRWNHPQRGVLYPADFITVAEETGIVVPMGQWVLMEACRQLKAWDARAGGSSFTMSVNISARHFMHPHLVDQVHEVLQETGVPPHRLILEVTESLLMENSEYANSVLTRLKSLGVQLHLDDFGTGYSSLSYLHRFPIDSLKIDKSFVGSMGTDPDTEEIVRVIIMLAQNLGLGAIAEGIETSKQLAQLISFGCRNGQGYLYSPGLEQKAVAQLMDSLHDNHFRIS